MNFGYNAQFWSSVCWSSPLQKALLRPIRLSGLK